MERENKLDILFRSIAIGADSGIEEIYKEKGNSLDVFGLTYKAANC